MVFAPPPPPPLYPANKKPTPSFEPVFLGPGVTDLPAIDPKPQLLSIERCYQVLPFVARQRLLQMVPTAGDIKQAEVRVVVSKGITANGNALFSCSIRSKGIVPNGN